MKNPTPNLLPVNGEGAKEQIPLVPSLRLGTII
jgi:hypothetical protein